MKKCQEEKRMWKIICKSQVSDLIARILNKELSLDELDIKIVDFGTGNITDLKETTVDNLNSLVRDEDMILVEYDYRE